MDDTFDPERPTSDDDVRKTLDEAADATQRPHDDEAERAHRQKEAERAGHNPRREGEGIHPGSH